MICEANRIKGIKTYWKVLEKLNNKLHMKEIEILKTLTLKELEEWENDLALEVYEIEEDLKQLKDNV